jgi:hypothetical protein
MTIGAAAPSFMSLLRQHIAGMRLYADELVDSGKLERDSEIVARIRSCASDLERHAERVRDIQRNQTKTLQEHEDERKSDK